MLIIPYFQKREIKKKKKNILIGSKYAMLEKRYSYLKKSIISKNVEKVLNLKKKYDQSWNNG